MRLLNGAPEVILRHEYCLHSAKTLHFMIDHIFSIGFKSRKHAGQSFSLDPKKNDRREIGHLLSCGM